jgi:hypothetical protein
MRLKTLIWENCANINNGYGVDKGGGDQAPKTPQTGPQGLFRSIRDSCSQGPCEDQGEEAPEALFAGILRVVVEELP